VAGYCEYGNEYFSSIKEGKTLISLAAIRFSRRDLIHGVTCLKACLCVCVCACFRLFV
jgi:hypothetical protein